MREAAIEEKVKSSLYIFFAHIFPHLCGQYIRCVQAW